MLICKMYMFKHTCTFVDMCVSVDMTTTWHVCQGTILSVGPWLPSCLRQCLFVVHCWINQANWLRSFQRFCLCLPSFCRIWDYRHILPPLDLYGFWRIRTQVFVLVQQAFYPGIHFILILRHILPYLRLTLNSFSSYLCSLIIGIWYHVMFMWC